MAAGAPELTNFGSLIRFALELEATASSFYEAFAERQTPSDLQSLFRELGAQHAGRHRLLEKTRQQKLNEMVLEPISGLDGARYAYDPSFQPQAPAIPRALAIEGVAARFYEESAVIAESLLTEAARTLQKLAEENHRNEARLKAFA